MTGVELYSSGSGENGDGGEDTDYSDESEEGVNIIEESSEEDYYENAAEWHELENGWEPEVENPSTPLSSADADSVKSSVEREHIQLPMIDGHIQINSFPNDLAGSPLQDAGIPQFYEQHQTMLGSNPNPYSPFASKLDWEFARWAKLHGPSSTAISE